MRSVLIGFCSGVISVAWFPLTLKMLCAGGIFLCLLCLVCISCSKNAHVRKYTPLVGGLTFGVAYAIGVGAHNLQHRLNDCGTNQRVSAIMRISSIPIEIGDRQSFDVDILSGATIQPDTSNDIVTCDSLLQLRKLRLSWYGGEKVSQNQIWRIDAKLRAPRGFQNPGGFDYEAWMFRSRFDASGIVKSATLLEGRTRALPGSVEGLRERAREYFLQSSMSQVGVMLALVTGDDQAISKTQWALFRATGTIHLVVISGLHIGLIAALGFTLGQLLVRFFPPLLLRTRARLPGVLTGMVCSYAYCELSGWNVPAQRAFIMLSIVASMYLLNRRLHSGNSLLVVIACLLVLDPLSPLVIGFWLSLGAVTVLFFYFVPRRSISGGEFSESGIRYIVQKIARAFIGLLKMQGVLFVGMLPLFWIWLGQISWVAPFANLLAVPVISWLVVPGAMMSFVLSGTGIALSESLQMLSNSALEFLFFFLENLQQTASNLELSYTQAGRMNGVDVFAWMITALSSTLLLLPLDWRIRILLLAGLLIPFVGQRSGLESGQFRLTVFDVGQGSAYLIETEHRRLLYDTAAYTRTGFNFGEAVVVPALLHSGVRLLDVIVLSHADIDHVGGHKAISRYLEIGVQYHGSPAPDNKGIQCRAGQTWEWDGILFEFIHPGLGSVKSKNDQSCVLLVKNADHSVLLTGDISKNVEYRILSGLKPLSVLVVAHHGSNTSSSTRFLKTVQPDISIISAGYVNQYKHPHPDVMNRLERFSREIWVTGDSGAITWTSEQPDRINSMRLAPAPYWRVRRIDAG